MLSCWTGPVECCSVTLPAALPGVAVLTIMQDPLKTALLQLASAFACMLLLLC